MIRLTGYILLLISCISFLLILVFPWFDFSKGKIAAVTTGLIITGEITFYLSIFILGKSFYNKLKKMFSFRKKENSDPHIQDSENHL
jgi:hypothetical protein